jgi:hypothetical protein
MKIVIFAVLTLAIGIGIGLYTTWQEFQGERLPTKMTLAVLAERGAIISTEGPQVFVEGGEIYDFGTMDRGSTGKHDFVFRNDGTKPLIVTMKETTCKCTAAAAGGKKMESGDQQTILPGKAFTLTLDWLVKSPQRDFSQSAEFETNDPRRGVVRLCPRRADRGAHRALAR